MQHRYLDTETRRRRQPSSSFDLDRLENLSSDIPSLHTPLTAERSRSDPHCYRAVWDYGSETIVINQRFSIRRDGSSRLFDESIQASGQIAGVRLRLGDEHFSSKGKISAWTGLENIMLDDVEEIQLQVWAGPFCNVMLELLGGQEFVLRVYSWAWGWGERSWTE